LPSAHDPAVPARCAAEEWEGENRREARRNGSEETAGRFTVSKLRSNYVLAGLALVVVVASSLACGGGEYAMVSPGGENWWQQIKDKARSFIATVKGKVKGFWDGLLDLVGLADCGTTLDLTIVQGARGHSRRFAWFRPASGCQLPPVVMGL
jgi:hypothetical protein